MPQDPFAIQTPEAQPEGDRIANEAAVETATIEHAVEAATEAASGIAGGAGSQVASSAASEAATGSAVPANGATREIVLEEADFASLANVHELLADELDFPDYYGQNLSALWDCLGDADDPVRFIVSRADDPACRRDWFDRLLNVLQRANDQLPNVETVVR